MSIFVSIASYSDPECINTLNNCFLQAKYPDKIFVGICQQNSPNDTDCYNKERNSQIRIIRLSTEQARGPTYARYLCSTLYKNETYFLQIDSHTKFSHHWDEKFIHMYQYLQTISAKPVISYYPNEWNDPTTKVGRITNVKWDNKNIPTFPGATLLEPEEYPTLTGFSTGNCLFLRGEFLTDVPFDPNLPHLFTGEEILFSVRLWTSGYDIYSPNENLLWHLYTRSNYPKFWNNWNEHDNDTGALTRARYILGIGSLEDVPTNLRKDLDMYGLGKTRNISDYWKFVKFNVNKSSTTKLWYILLGILSIILIVASTKLTT